MALVASGCNSGEALDYRDHIYKAPYTQHNETLHNDTQHDIQHNKLSIKGWYVTHSTNDTQHNDWICANHEFEFCAIWTALYAGGCCINLLLCWMSFNWVSLCLSVIMLSVIMLSDVVPFTTLHFLRNLQMGPLSCSVVLPKTGNACQWQTL
jgi:hypothetical protein